MKDFFGFLKQLFGLGNKVYDDVTEKNEASTDKKLEKDIRKGKGGDARKRFLKRQRLRRARKAISDKRA